MKLQTSKTKCSLMGRLSRALGIAGLSILLSWAMAACSEENVPAPPAQGSLESEGDSRVTLLNLTGESSDAVSPDEELTFQLVNPAKDVSYQFTGKLTYDHTISHFGLTGAFQCRLNIGNVNIEDGEYFLTIIDKNVEILGMRKVRFSGNIGEEVNTPTMKYTDLEGSGTEYDPYLINDDGDLLTLLWYLEEDANHGFGYYFRQTADFDLPRRSQMIDGHVWSATTFAGHYDGAGHSLRHLVYQGGSDETEDSNIGLFSNLLNATVENLTLTDILLTNTASCTGAIAGAAYGNSVFRNISVSGTIASSGHSIGGLVGEAKGDIQFDGIEITSLFINASTSSRNVGGIVGYISGTNCKIYNVSSPEHVFSVNGGSNVGGIIGMAERLSTLYLNNIKLEHSVDKESSTTKIIYGEGEYVGGIAGLLRENYSVNLDNVTIKAPTRGMNHIGGLFGSAQKNSQIVISSTLLSSVVKGTESVGGFVGSLETGKDQTFTIGGEDNTTRYVVKSSAAAEVEGVHSVGGMAGLYSGFDLNIQMKSKVEIAVNVKGDEAVGGAIGRMTNKGYLDVDGFNFSSPTMRVEASSRFAGGIIGSLEGGEVHGGHQFNLESSIPSSKDLRSHFSGVVKAGEIAGGIVGYSKCFISGVASSASVTAMNNVAGGIVAQSENNLSHCAFMGSVSGKDYVGGLIGISDGAVELSSLLNLADISSGTTQGGVVAYIRNNISVPNQEVGGCYNKGKLSNGSLVGGVVGLYNQGKAASTLIEDCGNSGDISAAGTTSTSVGGVVGHYQTTHFHVKGCANHGNISSGKEQLAIGGVIGEIGTRSNTEFCQGEVVECMNSGTISNGLGSTKLGGIVGILHQTNSNGFTAYATIQNCYNLGDIPSKQKNDTGGILGFAGAYSGVYRTFNDGMIEHGNATMGTHTAGTILFHGDNYYVEGTGKSWPSSKSVKSDKVSDLNSYSGFDFNKVWKITMYGPRLQHCPFQDQTR